ncbi:MAG: leucine-rich repeat domain-containing protein, partial [Oscillospiraceae bacterium]|nr:leucine-rich repeat domain-containing protein [Oscillospiraceae bacterium]
MNYRKTLAVLTALAACASVTAMPAGVQNNDNTSIFAVEAAEAAKLEEGSLGDKVGFVIYDNGEMIISGSGAITQTTEDLENRNSVTSIIFKDDADGGVNEICEAAFCRMEKLEAVTLPKSLKTIENIAFAGCGKLLAVTIPENTESIGSQAFAYTALKDITVPDSVKSLGEKAFEGCAGLEKAQIGCGIKQAVPELFKDCKSLTELTIPNFETEIADYGEYSEGAKVAVKDMFNVISPIITECSVSKITILDGAEVISPYEFSGMSSLKEVVIPDTVTKISEAAFSLCDSIEKITLPSGLKNIENIAFAGCR